MIYLFVAESIYWNCPRPSKIACTCDNFFANPIAALGRLDGRGLQMLRVKNHAHIATAFEIDETVETDDNGQEVSESLFMSILSLAHKKRVKHL